MEVSMEDSHSNDTDHRFDDDELAKAGVDDKSP